jgi:hypothetical protein
LERWNETVLLGEFGIRTFGTLIRDQDRKRLRLDLEILVPNNE